MDAISVAAVALRIHVPADEDTDAFLCRHLESVAWQTADATTASKAAQLVRLVVRHSGVLAPLVATALSECPANLRRDDAALYALVCAQLLYGRTDWRAYLNPLLRMKPGILALVDFVFSADVERFVGSKWRQELDAEFVSTTLLRRLDDERPVAYAWLLSCRHRRRSAPVLTRPQTPRLSCYTSTPRYHIDARLPLRSLYSTPRTSCTARAALSPVTLLTLLATSTSRRAVQRMTVAAQYAHSGPPRLHVTRSSIAEATAKVEADRCANIWGASLTPLSAPCVIASSLLHASHCSCGTM